MHYIRSKDQKDRWIRKEFIASSSPVGSLTFWHCINMETPSPVGQKWMMRGALQREMEIFLTCPASRGRLSLAGMTLPRGGRRLFAVHMPDLGSAF